MPAFQPEFSEQLVRDRTPPITTKLKHKVNQPFMLDTISIQPSDLKWLQKKFAFFHAQPLNIFRYPSDSSPRDRSQISKPFASRIEGLGHFLASCARKSRRPKLSCDRAVDRLEATLSLRITEQAQLAAGPRSTNRSPETRRAPVQQWFPPSDRSRTRPPSSQG